MAMFIVISSIHSFAEETKIIAKIIRIDGSKGFIYVMHDSRIIKLRTSKEICKNFESKINSIAEIEYAKCPNKGLCIVSINIVHYENYKKDSQSNLDIDMILEAKYAN